MPRRFEQVAAPVATDWWTVAAAMLAAVAMAPAAVAVVARSRELEPVCWGLNNSE